MLFCWSLGLPVPCKMRGRAFTAETDFPVLVFALLAGQKAVSRRSRESLAFAFGHRLVLPRGSWHGQRVCWGVCCPPGCPRSPFTEPARLLPTPLRLWVLSGKPTPHLFPLLTPLFHPLRLSSQVAPFMKPFSISSPTTLVPGRMSQCLGFRSPLCDSWPKCSPLGLAVSVPLNRRGRSRWGGGDSGDSSCVLRPGMCRPCASTQMPSV